MAMKQMGWVREQGTVGTAVKWVEQLLISSSHGGQAGMQPRVATSFDLLREARNPYFYVKCNHQQ